MFANNTLSHKHCLLLHVAFTLRRLCGFDQLCPSVWALRALQNLLSWCPCFFCPRPMVQEPVSDPGAISSAAAGIFSFQNSDSSLAHNPGSWTIPEAGAVLALLGFRMSLGWDGDMGPGWSQGVSGAPVLKPLGRNWTLWHPDYMLSWLKHLS